MRRKATDDLLDWLDQPKRQPLVLRGARQVGKTWLVRDLAERGGRTLVEINFERDPSFRDCFADNDPRQILARIGLRLKRRVDPSTAILFLDEIQAFGECLAKLRWFYEELPELPVIAAGSLLEFSLRDHSYSMPVGRIAFYNLYPLDFSEFLAASEAVDLAAHLDTWTPADDDPLDAVVHEAASQAFETFSMVGAMPAVVDLALQGGSSEEIRDAQQQLCATYRADFPKYSGRIDPNVLESVLNAVVRQLGQKFVLARVADNVAAQQAKSALELLCQARLCREIRYSSGNGIPLSAEAKDKFRKIALLDVGILHALMDMPAVPTFPPIQSLSPAVKAKLSEQLAAQQLCLLGSKKGEPRRLYYWQREGGRPGEIDHLVQHRDRVVPIELKAGASGSMKSLHQFMFDKNLNLAIRIDANPPTCTTVRVRTTQGDPVQYQLLSLPLYLLYRLHELLDAID